MPRPDDTMQTAVEAFTAYADGVKVLHGHLTDLKKSSGDTLGKAGFAAQSLVEACEEAGPLAAKAISLRSVVGRTQAALIRKMEGAEITMERLEHVTRALATSRLKSQILSAFLGETTREDFIPYTADFLLQLEGVRWAIVSGIVNGQLIISVRNLGYSRNAGEFVKTNFGDIGSAGGHRALAKAVVPAERFFGKFGHLSGVGVAARIGELAEQFLTEPTGEKKPSDKIAKS